MKIIENVAINCRINFDPKLSSAICQVRFWFVGTIRNILTYGSDGRGEEVSIGIGEGTNRLEKPT